MKKFELNVVNFDNEDVIATSIYLEAVLANHGNVAGNHYEVYKIEDDERSVLTSGYIDTDPNGRDGYDFQILSGEGCRYKLKYHTGRGYTDSDFTSVGIGGDYVSADVAGVGNIDGKYTYSDGVYTKIN